MNRLSRMVALGAIAVGAALSVAAPAGAVVNIGGVTPQSGTFAEGDVITVSGAPGTVAGGAQPVISLCRGTNVNPSFDPFTDCDFTGSVLTLDPAAPDGSFSNAFDILDPASFDCTVATPCRLRINTGTFADVSDQAFTPAAFVITGPVTTTSTPVSTTSTSVATTTTAPDPIIPEAPLNVLIPLGGAAAIGGAYFLLRRGRTA
jgi:hypothetical protein